MGVEILGEAGVVGKARDGSARSRGNVEGDDVDGLGGSGCAEGVLSSCNSRFALEVFVEGLEEPLPRLPCLIRFGLPVPCWVVVGEGVGLEDGGRGKGGEPGSGDGEVGAVGLALGLLEPHDVLRHAGVGRPLGWEFREEGNDVGGLKAADGVSDVRKELEQTHNFVEGVFLPEGDVKRLVEGVEQELAAAVLRGGGASLVFQLGSPDGLVRFLIPRPGFRRDGGIIFGEGDSSSLNDVPFVPGVVI